ncbi:hypothetical protein [Rhodococcus globerulus]|uniref:Uncharacterized protein n=1 Tax=Rhodococcus globerulus TaxID=33008 RepID=A0ABU4C545_RHOGO|nr:hypothetical protein [Rhodococcus globerulus]MDV6271625.1 hypothetical protein [Rhodococcus globerulus]
MSWKPAPDEGQAGTVLLPNGEWAYRYKGSTELIHMKKPPTADDPAEAAAE